MCIYRVGKQNLQCFTLQYFTFHNILHYIEEFFFSHVVIFLHLSSLFSFTAVAGRCLVFLYRI